jgi:hypothetical protein
VTMTPMPEHGYGGDSMTMGRDTLTRVPHFSARST